MHLFETHCAFLPLFNPNLDFLQAEKVTKSGHLLHDQASKGNGSFPGLTLQTSLRACLQRLNPKCASFLEGGGLQMPEQIIFSQFTLL